jgi:uncharacterized protein with PIN domain
VARFLADENFPLRVTRELRVLGHDVVTLQELGKTDQGLADSNVLALATEQGRAVLTLNRRHFVRLHQETPDHAGIVVCSLDLDFDGQARRIAVAVEGKDALTGQLLRINRPG